MKSRSANSESLWHQGFSPSELRKSVNWDFRVPARCPNRMATAVVPVGRTNDGVDCDVAYERRSQDVSDLIGPETCCLDMHSRKAVDAAESVSPPALLLTLEKVPVQPGQLLVWDSRIVDRPPGSPLSLSVGGRSSGTDPRADSWPRDGKMGEERDRQLQEV